MSSSDLTLLEHHHQLVNAIAKTEDIPRQVRNLLVGLATYFNVHNQCAFPSRKQLTTRTGYCANHITALIKQAVDLGFLKSTPQYIQVDGEAAPRQVANKYEFILDKFGLFYSKTKALFNRNKRKKEKEQKNLDASLEPMREFVNEQIAEALEVATQENEFYFDDSPPK